MPTPRSSSFADAVARRAEARPDEEVVRVVGSAPWTAASVWDRSMAVATGLARVVRRGDAVATCLPAGPEAIVVTTALSILGAVEVPVPPDVDRQWARVLVDATRCVTTVTTADGLAAAQFLGSLGSHPALPTLTIDRPGPGAVALDDLAASARPVTPVELAPGDPALVMTTSGTTGRVKGALLPVAAGPAQATRVQRAMGYDASDVLFNCFPWHHINARHAAFLPAVIAGARLVVGRSFSASRFFDLARAEGVTAFNFMGAVCAMLLAQPATPHDRAHQIRRAYGGPAPAAMVHAMQERFGVTLLQAYACTELGDVSITAASDLRPGAAGRPVPDYQVRVVDDAGDTVPPGGTGELLVRPERPHLTFIEYVGDPGATARAWRGEWFRTGDRVRLDEGWLFFEGRSADVIRRRGVNISPELVEDAIGSLAGVAEVAAVGVPSELTEDEVLAVVVPAPGSTLRADDVWRHAAGVLPRHATPRFVSIEDALPHNASHKVSRARLRDRGLPAGAWDSLADRAHPGRVAS